MEDPTWAESSAASQTDNQALLDSTLMSALINTAAATAGLATLICLATLLFLVYAIVKEINAECVQQVGEARGAGPGERKKGQHCAVCATRERLERAFYDDLMNNTFPSEVNRRRELHL